ncbi:hypothetical protein WICPIJ_005548 [Wickerhamomyces pijperi]|uniref:AAA+ ATPase domain-containing protein n=1 Tax=Wickerhamomyces pijperi TaxID=599730 RepID=A0A9P8TLT8_WICPI|nr:hypothetical protein WICPIJ_005548 [Wickerhamomyces pijperi]
MNFMRKKQTPLIDELSSIYSKLANQTITNLELEKQGEYEKAIRGWKSIHTQVLFRMDLIYKNYPNHDFSADEYSVKDGIDDMIQKAIVHLTRVECTFNDLYPDHSRKPSITSMNSATNSPSVPTMRSRSVQSFASRQQQQPQVQSQQTSRFLKTLRPSNNKSPSSNSFTTSNASSASWIAANTATHSNTFPYSSSPAKPNWTTSKPLPQRSHSPVKNDFDGFNTAQEDLNLFDDSFNQDDLVDFNEKMDKRNESLSRLEAVGKESQLARFKTHVPDTILPSQFEKLQVSSTSSSPSPRLSDDGFSSNVNEMKRIRSSTPPTKSQGPPRPPIPRTKPLIDFESTTTKSQTASIRRIQQPKPSTTSSNSYSKPAPQQRAENQPIKVAPKPSIPQVKPMVRPVIKSYAKQQTSKTNSAATKPVSKPAAGNSTPNRAAPAARPRATKPKPSNNTLKAPTPTSNSRSRSESPRFTKAETEANSDNNPSYYGKDEAELTEKEIKEKMEDQIISEIPGIDYQSAKQIFNEIVVQGDEVHWEDIAGLESAKNSLKETVVYPFLRPDLFSGLREPARGMLLFGPPGTGKTMLARAVATESKSTFFSISASSLTSKYLGESEKLVRALFLLARKLSPAIVFVDEIDSILSSRSENGENESSRRIKNEFLIQWSNLTHAAAGNDHGEDLQRVLVLAATNLPWQIDEAARRRFVRRQYIPLPEFETRLSHLRKLIKHQIHNITEDEILQLAEMTDGYSGSDITALAKDAAMGPLRSLGEKLLFTEKADIRGIELQDFVNSLNYIKPSVSKENLKEFDEWADKFGSSGV